MIILTYLRPLLKLAEDRKKRLSVSWLLVVSLVFAGYGGGDEVVRAAAAQGGGSRAASGLSRDEARRQIKAAHIAQSDDSVIERIPVNELSVEPPGSPLANTYPKTALLGTAGLLQVDLIASNRRHGNMRYYDHYKATVTEKFAPFVIRISTMSCMNDECAVVIVAKFSDVDILGVGEPAPDSGRIVSVVDYKVVLSPTEVGKTLGTGQTTSETKHARFVRYDDGWRLVN